MHVLALPTYNIILTVCSKFWESKRSFCPSTVACIHCSKMSATNFTMILTFVSWTCRRSQSCFLRVPIDLNVECILLFLLPNIFAHIILLVINLIICVLVILSVKYFYCSYKKQNMIMLIKTVFEFACEISLCCIK